MRNTVEKACIIVENTGIIVNRLLVYNKYTDVKGAAGEGSEEMRNMLLEAEENRILII